MSRFSKNSIKQELSTESLPGYITSEPVTSLQSLRPRLLSINLSMVLLFQMPFLQRFLFLWQAALLLLFNGADRLSYSEIVTQLNLSDDDVVRLLDSLSCAKHKILNKEPANRSISPNDVFEFNSKFIDKMRRIKVYFFCMFSRFGYLLF